MKNCFRTYITFLTVITCFLATQLNGTFLFDSYFKSTKNCKFKVANMRKTKDLLASGLKSDNAYVKFKSLCAIQAFSCRILVEALETFASCNTQRFDPVVGDSQCQSRAVRLAQLHALLNNPASPFNQITQLVITKCKISHTVISQNLNMSKDNFLNWITENYFKLSEPFTLDNFFKKMSADIDLKEIICTNIVCQKNEADRYADYIKFIALSYFNTLYQTVESNLEKYDLNHWQVAQEIISLTEVQARYIPCDACERIGRNDTNPKCNECFSIAFHDQFSVRIIELHFKEEIQKTISQLSQDFLSEDIAVLDEIEFQSDASWMQRWSEIKVALTKLSVSDKFKISPAYFSMQILLKRALANKTPLVVRAHYYCKHQKQNPYIRHFFYKVNANYEFELCQRNDVANTTAIFLYGVSFPGNSREWIPKFKEEFEQFAREHKELDSKAQTCEETAQEIERFKAINIAELVECYQATEPDYYGSARTKFDWKSYPVSHGYKLEQEARTKQEGFCAENLFVFCPDHMYTVFINSSQTE